MSSDQKKDDAKAAGEKKDLTGIFELAALSPPQIDPANEDPFAVNEMQAVEQVDEFVSIDTLEMIDHEPETFEPIEEAISPAQEGEDLFPVTESPGELLETSDPFAPFKADLSAQSIAAVNDFALPEMTYGSNPASLVESAVEHKAENEAEKDGLHAPPPMSFLDEMKSYSQRTQESAFEPGIKAPYHLSLQGIFDPYSRDRLLLFIIENPIGINSSDLDLQLQSGRVLFPRISEFAGIKLIQDLRDSGLLFRLVPSSRDDDEISRPTAPRSFHFHAETPEPSLSVIPVLPAAGFDQSAWKVIDSIQMVQYLRAEILEVEKSELFQDLIDRMLQAMKRKAHLKGADALSHLTHHLTPLRLPSQYQVELRANLLKKL